MRRSGFTLLEVLLAIFVLATSMGTLLALMSDNLRALSRATLDAEAMGLAAGLLVGRHDFSSFRAAD